MFPNAMKEKFHVTYTYSLPLLLTLHINFLISRFIQEQQISYLPFEAKIYDYTPPCIIHIRPSCKRRLYFELRALTRKFTVHGILTSRSVFSV